MRIAYFSPLPPERSGVADYSATLLPHLGRLAEITLYHAHPDTLSPELSASFETRGIATFQGPLAEGLDICLYQMGNNIDYHREVYLALRRYPGITVLHDLNIHSFYGELWLKNNRVPAYVREMAYAYGRAGANHARRAQRGQVAYDVFRYPLLERVGNLSLGVIAHSRYAQGEVAGRCPRTPAAHIHQPAAVFEAPLSQAAAKKLLGYDAGTILMASFGYISSAKRTETTLRAMAELRPRYPQLRLALVGQVIGGYNVADIIHELGLEEVVKLVGFADRAIYETYLAATDIGVNLRYPTFGETSASLLDLMAAGKPTLVSNVDAFVELPDDACLKVDIGPMELEQVQECLHRLIEDEARRRLMGANAVAYVRQNCDPAYVADQYVAFIEQVLGRLSAISYQLSALDDNKLMADS